MNDLLSIGGRKETDDSKNIVRGGRMSARTQPELWSKTEGGVDAGRGEKSPKTRKGNKLANLSGLLKQGKVASARQDVC